MKGSGEIYKQETHFKDNHSQNIRDKLKFSCQIVNYGISSNFVFQETFTSTNKTFNWWGRPCTEQ